MREHPQQFGISMRGRLFFYLATLHALIRQRRLAELVSKAYRLWKREGITGVRRHLWKIGHNVFNYTHWVEQFDTLDNTDRQAIRKHIARLHYRPLISVLMPTYNSQERWLREAIESVRNQLYPDWELCIADDASTLPHVRATLEKYQRLDERIRIVFRDSNGHISAASNSALKIASGEFVALLDHDDELPEHALYTVVAALNDKSDLDLIYSDEDKIDENNYRYDPYFKPDWNPDLLTSQNMICHLGVYRTELVRKIGGFLEGYEGAQDWDLALRITEHISFNRIKHLPFILYHWRVTNGSTAMSISEKPYALRASEAALSDHLDRIGRRGEVLLATAVHFRIRYSIPSPAPLVSIVIPTHNRLALLRHCINSLKEKTRYPNYEILVVDNQSDDLETLDYLNQIASAGTARVIRYDLPFNYSALNNFAVKETRGSYLCLMNNDIEIISEDWLDEMISQAARPEIGAVGAKLYYPDNTIQHAGVILGMGDVAGHLYSKIRRSSSGYMSRLLLVQDISAVTAACLVVRKDVYEEAGGLDERNLPVAFNDVDFCLRLLERGYRNLWTPFAELYHHESATRGPEDTPEKQKRFQREIAYMQTRWRQQLLSDPAYNPNLALDSAWPNLAPPRISKPWQH